jgi:hypothetical protein
MGNEYVILSLVRLGILAFSFFVLPQGMVMIQAAWHANDHKKMRRGVSLLWGGIIAGCVFLKMFGGVK